MALGLALLDPATLETVPEEFESVLECTSLAICCSFNRRGSLLAVGCNDGRVVIWDFLTRGVAKCIPAHLSFPVCSIGWSRNSRRIISTGLDNTVAVWDVLSNVCLFRLKLPSSILKSQFNPRNDKLLLICPLKYPSLLVELDYEQGTVKYEVLPKDGEDPDLNIVSTFDRRGKYIYSGNAKGRLYIVRCPGSVGSKGSGEGEKLELISSFRVQTSSSSPAAIREIEFGSRNKNTFLVNTSDRTIRLYDCMSALGAGVNGSCEEIRKFQDLVNKTMWRRCCFSGDTRGAFVCGGSSRQHALYIWEADNGSIKKMLQGTNGELLLDIQWHPLRPILASISSGLISIWARPQIENWSAFAPDFRELEENMEYEERESEFDIEDEDNVKTLDKEDDNEMNDVDVDGIKAETDLISSDEEDLDPNYLEFIPINVEDLQTADTTQPDASYVPPLRDEDVKELRDPINIDMENPPVDEAHPLATCSSKRIRVNDKIGSGRKTTKQA